MTIRSYYAMVIRKYKKLYQGAVFIAALFLTGCASKAVLQDPEKLRQIQVRQSKAGVLYSWFTGQATICTLQAIGLTPMPAFVIQYVNGDCQVAIQEE